MTQALERLLDDLEPHLDGRYGHDFLQTWDMNDHALAATVLVTQTLKWMTANNISPRIYDTGLGVSIFKDQSTRTRYSFNSSMDLLGLDPVELDMGKSQIAHGETVLETANMIAFLTRVIGIRDDVYLGVGHRFISEVARSLERGVADRVLGHRPSVINLQSDTDHPTQSMADLCHVVEYAGGFEQLRGKKFTMSWAYSPSYGKPLSVPQGVGALFTRFGMDVTLAYPEGYSLIPETEELMRRNAAASGGSFRLTHDMHEAFEGADFVYPKSWASYAIMEQRTKLLLEGNKNAYEQLEKEALAENARHTDWECTEDLMRKTRNGSALYLHCLPAEISEVSEIRGKVCEVGEVAATVFDRYRADLYRQARNKPFSIAAMTLLGQLADPVGVLHDLVRNPRPLSPVLKAFT
ncbi:MAG: knotted carbamoyltransferase YgeW [Deltaproteobacteria bacterium RIFOXYA12_FULL_61_11]|nr:MAG: knotted carbamoyltransferase YgeW [Deltaproteobacteria bacterium RIFOXYA12_FULL_61_11]